MFSQDTPDGATPLNPDEADGLKLPHITTRGELNRWEQDNILKAYGWLEKTRPIDIVNQTFIKELHIRMFGNVWQWAGRYRQSMKNIGIHAYLIPEAVRNLCDDAAVWIRNRNEHPDIIAIRFHHRLVSIHPFANGNGRHARLMADLLLENTLKTTVFTWGGQELASAGDTRKQYITALQLADRGNLVPLLQFARS